MNSFLLRTLGAIGAVPLKFCAVVIAISFAVDEWFPFSEYPMYSVAQNPIWYLYVADASGQPIPVLGRFGVGCGFVRKQFQTRTGEYKDRARREGRRDAKRADFDEAAAQDVIDYLRALKSAHAGPSGERLRIYRVTIEQDDGAIHRTSELLAEERAR